MGEVQLRTPCSLNFLVYTTRNSYWGIKVPLFGITSKYTEYGVIVFEVGVRTNLNNDISPYLVKCYPILCLVFHGLLTHNSVVCGAFFSFDISTIPKWEPS